MGRAIPRSKEGSLVEGLEGLQVRGALAATTIGLEFIGHALVAVERAHAGGFDRADVHERVVAAVIGLDEAIALVGVENFTVPIGIVISLRVERGRPRMLWTILAARLEPEVRLRPLQRPAPAIAREEERIQEGHAPMASAGQEAAGLRVGVDVQLRTMMPHMPTLRLALAAGRGVKRAQLRDVEILEELIDIGQGCRSICCTSKSVEQRCRRSLSRA